MLLIHQRGRFVLFKRKLLIFWNCIEIIFFCWLNSKLRDNITISRYICFISWCWVRFWYIWK